MARILNDDEMKAVTKALMVEWQKGHEQLGLNLANDLLCRVEVGEKMDALLNGEDNYNFHINETELFDDNIAELLSEYHNKKAQEQAREQEVKEMVDEMEVSDCGDGLIKFQFGNNEPKE